MYLYSTSKQFSWLLKVYGQPSFIYKSKLMCCFLLDCRFHNRNRSEWPAMLPGINKNLMWLNNPITIVHCLGISSSLWLHLNNPITLQKTLSNGLKHALSVARNELSAVSQGMYQIVEIQTYFCVPKQFQKNELNEVKLRLRKIKWADQDN